MARNGYGADQYYRDYPSVRGHNSSNGQRNDSYGRPQQSRGRANRGDERSNMRHIDRDPHPSNNKRQREDEQHGRTNKQQRTNSPSDYGNDYGRGHSNNASSASYKPTAANPSTSSSKSSSKQTSNHHGSKQTYSPTPSAPPATISHTQDAPASSVQASDVQTSAAQEPVDNTLTEDEILAQRKAKREALLKAARNAVNTTNSSAPPPSNDSSTSPPVDDTVAATSGATLSESAQKTDAPSLSNTLPNAGNPAVATAQAPNAPPLGNKVSTSPTAGGPAPVTSPASAQNTVGTQPLQPTSAAGAAPGQLNVASSASAQNTNGAPPVQQNNSSSQASSAGASNSGGAGSDDFDMFQDDVPDDDPGASVALDELYGKAKTIDNAKGQWDEDDEHFKIVAHELLNPHGPKPLQVISQLGKGTFATVIKALVHPKPVNGTPEFVAVKIATSNHTMAAAARKERDLVRLLNEEDRGNIYNIVRLQSDFHHKGHLCLQFELLDADIRQTLKEPSNRAGLSIKNVRECARRLFNALHLLQKNDIIHADLKPDNVFIRMAKEGNVTACKLGDFGTALKTIDATRDLTLVSRFYRAPEIMMGHAPSHAIDVWAIGCTLFELLTNRILFDGRDNHDMLCVIQDCRGKIPNRLVKLAPADVRSQHFSKTDALYEHENGPKIRSGKVPAGKDIKSRVHAAFGPTRMQEDEESHRLPQLIELIEKCLVLDPKPESRIDPGQALNLDFFKRAVPTGNQSKGRTGGVAGL
ncbi:hypothetical protein MBLNU230_g4147t1 [Neophaeotheca triangularis]